MLKLTPARAHLRGHTSNRPIPFLRSFRHILPLLPFQLMLLSLSFPPFLLPRPKSILLAPASPPPGKNADTIQVFAKSTPIREGRIITLSSSPCPRSSNSARKRRAGFTKSGVYFARRPTPMFHFVNLDLGGKRCESRSMCLWSGRLFCKHRYNQYDTYHYIVIMIHTNC